MSKIWERSYLLEISPAGGEPMTYKPPMQINFAVVNSPENQAATARISIYGVSAPTRQLIQKYDETRKNFGTVRLSAGYAEVEGLIFEGDINSVEVGRDNSGTYIRLYCWRNFDRWRNALLNKTWGEGTTAATVISEVATAFNQPVEMIGNFDDLPRFIKGYTMPGISCRDWLNLLKEQWGFSWWMSLSKTVIARNNAARDGVSYEIHSQNGMEGVPRWYLRNMEVDIKMNTQIQPGDVVHISSRFWTINYSSMYNTSAENQAQDQTGTGKFRVLATAHQGDYWNDSWKTTLKCLWYR